MVKIYIEFLIQIRFWLRLRSGYLQKNPKISKTKIQKAHNFVKEKILILRRII